ncbi:MAG: hypothetical protein AAB400_01230 [Patescibacteria group bacterium]
MAGRNPFERIWNAIKGAPNEYETPPPPQARPDVRAPREVDRTATERYRVEEGRITQERPGRLEARAATPPSTELSDAQKAAETKEYMDAVMRGLQEMRTKEQEVLENRYGRGMLSAFRGFNQWLHETDLGRTVKIAGKVVGGLSMAACAGMLAGTPGIAFSPALALMGKKMAISGAIEAFQYFGGMRRERDPDTGRIQTQIGGKERLRRLDMEAGRNMRGNLEVVGQDLRDRFDRGEIDAEEFRQRTMTLVHDMQDNEEDILRNDREYEDIRKSNQRVRGFISTGATLGIGLLQGIPFGIQDLDKNGIAHSVIARFDGIRWAGNTVMSPLQSLMGNFGEVHGLVAGVGEGAFVGSGFPGNLAEYSHLLGGLGVAAAGMAAQTFREFGTFAQGSRARIRELLSENVRIEDGVVARPENEERIPRDARQYEHPIGPEPAPTAPSEQARDIYGQRRIAERPETPPTDSEEQGGARGIYGGRRALGEGGAGEGEQEPPTPVPTQQYERAIGPLQEGAQYLEPIGPEPAPSGPEGNERFTPLTQAEIRDAANSSDLARLILERLGAENIPPKLTYKDFSERFGEMLRNADAQTRDTMRQYIRDAYTAYEPVAKQPRDVKLESLRRISSMPELLPPPPPPENGGTPEAVEAKTQKALRREDLLVQPNNLRGIVLERIGAGAFAAKNITVSKFDTALNEWLKTQTDASISQTNKFIERSREHIARIEGLPTDNDKKIVQKNLTAARGILDALEQKILTGIVV